MSHEVAEPSDTSTSRQDLTCPLCGYSLRGLVDPRCPECGFAFQWRELIDDRGHQHPYLFEHGRGRSLVTFFKTYRANLRPWKFWTDLNPAMPVRPARLVVYWILASTFFLVPVAIPFFWMTMHVAWKNFVDRSHYTKVADGSYRLGTEVVSEDQLAEIYPRPWERYFAVDLREKVFDDWPDETFLGVRFYHTNSYSELDKVALPIVLAWPWVLMGTLLIFRRSMSRAKIKSIHVLRTVLYGCDFALPILVLSTAVSAFDYHWRTGIGMGWQIVAAIVACVLLATVKTSLGFSRYLRVHLPLATVAAAQIVVVMLMCLFMVYDIVYSETLFR